MSRPNPTFLAAGLSVVVGAGLGAAALALGGTGGSTNPASEEAEALRPVAPRTLAQNRRPLSAETQREIYAWATRLVGCLTDDGLAVGRPRRGENEVVIRPSPSLAKDPITLVTQMGSCTKALGKPPAGASVSFERQTKAISLYKPKTCPLPKFPKKTSQ